jgi:hypothetical protein
MAKKTGKSKGQKRTPSNRRAGSRAGARSRKAGVRAPTRSGKAGLKRKGGRKTAGTKTAKRTVARKNGTPSRTKMARPPVKGKARGSRKAAPIPQRGGTGRESELSQTPETGRSVRGRTNPMPTKRSTGTGAGAGDTRHVPGLERARRQLREVEEGIPTPPSSLDLDRSPSAARSGRRELRDARLEHNETSPEMTGGDVDADWEDAYAIGDEAPGGDNPTPDQDRVDDIGKALGIEYQDNEELKGADKIAERDRKRWELDPASAEDYPEHDRED